MYGLLRKYHEQNTHRRDYLHMVTKLFVRLRARGWDTALLKNLFFDATAKVEATTLSDGARPSNKKQHGNHQRRIFIHTEYHPNGIPRHQLRKAYMETCGEAFTDLETDNGGRLRIADTTIAYSRPPNLKDLLTSAKLKEGAGRGVSTFLQD